MEITHIPAGSRGADEIDEILAEVVDFDTLVNRASGLGPDFNPRRELLSPNEYVTHQTWIARLGGAIVAKGIAYLTLQDNLDVADVWCSVHPDRRRQGLGTELLAAMEKRGEPAHRSAGCRLTEPSRFRFQTARAVLRRADRDGCQTARG